MITPAGRPVARHIVAALLAALVVAACTSTSPNPVRTLEIAGETAFPTALPTHFPERSPGAAPTELPTPTAEPGPTNEPGLTGTPGADTAIVPGSVDRSSLEISATYRVNAAITVRTGALDVTTRIVATNESGDGIDRLELNTIAAKFGGMKVTAAIVDDVPVNVTVRDQTLLVPLGGILPSGASATITVAYKATLREAIADDSGCSPATAARSRCTAGFRGSAVPCRSPIRTTASRS